MLVPRVGEEGLGFLADRILVEDGHPGQDRKGAVRSNGRRGDPDSREEVAIIGHLATGIREDPRQLLRLVGAEARRRPALGGAEEEVGLDDLLGVEEVAGPELDHQEAFAGSR